MKIKRFKEKRVPVYNIGDIGPAGGIIYMTPNTDGNNTGQYFEVAQGMYPNNDIVGYPVVGKSQYLPTTGYPIMSDAIGKGKENTKILLDTYFTYLSDSTYLLKDLIDFRNSSSHNDWFIPSADELEKIWYAAIPAHLSAISYPAAGYFFKGSGNQLVGYGEWASSSAASLDTIRYFPLVPPGEFAFGPYLPGAVSGSPTTSPVNFLGRWYLMPIRSFYPYGV